MNRRMFLQGVAAAVAAVAIPSAVTAGNSDASRQAPTGAITYAQFESLALVECTVIDMTTGKQRKIAIDSPKPQRIDEGRKPFFLSVEEHDEEFLSVTFYHAKGKELVKAQRIFAGKNGMQILKDRGIVLQFTTYSAEA